VTSAATISIRPGRSGALDPMAEIDGTGKLVDRSKLVRGTIALTLARRQHLWSRGVRRTVCVTCSQFMLIGMAKGVVLTYPLAHRNAVAIRPRVRNLLMVHLNAIRGQLVLGSEVSGDFGRRGLMSVET
jgi:hypothetical protein